MTLFFRTAAVSYNPIYTRLTGDLSAGVLLSQLVYWFTPGKSGKTKLRVVRDGRSWLAKSRPDLMKETGLSEWKLRAAMDTLKTLGLVTTEVHLFGGKTVPHIHLHEDVLKDLLAQAVASELVGRKPQNRNGGILRAAREETSQPITDTTTETTTEREAAGYARDLDEPLFDITVVGEDDRPFTSTQGIGTHESTMKLDEILKAQQERRSNLPKGNGTSPLVMLWKRRLSGSTGSYVKDLTKQELGQLKMLGAQLGIESLTVLDWILTNWPTFAFEAKAKKGLTAAPTQPVIGFALKYHDVAVQLIAEQQAAKAAPSPATQPKATPAVVVAPKATEVPSKAAAADVEAALSMFGED